MVVRKNKYEVYVIIKKMILTNSLSVLVLLMASSSAFGMNAKIAQAKPAIKTKSGAGYQSKAAALCLSHLNINPDPKSQSELATVMTQYIIEKEDEKLDTVDPEAMKCMMLPRFFVIPFMKEDEIDDIIFNDFARLLEKRDVLEVTDKTGYTPLLFAVFVGNHRATKLLLDKGASMTVKNKSNLAAKELAAYQFIVTGDKKFQTIGKMLYECETARAIQEQSKIIAEKKRIQKEEADALMQLHQLRQAIVDNNLDAVRDCAKPGVINRKYADGSVSLLLAAGLGRTAIVTQLLAQGAQLSVHDENYNTPLALAVINGHVDVVELLLSHMTPVQISATMRGKTAYDLTKERATRIEKRLQEDPSNENVKQEQQKYERIVMLFVIRTLTWLYNGR